MASYTFLLGPIPRSGHYWALEEWITVREKEKDNSFIQVIPQNSSLFSHSLPFSLEMRNKGGQLREGWDLSFTPRAWATLCFLQGAFYTHWLFRLSQQPPAVGRAGISFYILQVRKLNPQEVSQPDQISSWCQSHVSRPRSIWLLTQDLCSLWSSRGAHPWGYTMANLKASSL